MPIQQLSVDKSMLDLLQQCDLQISDIQQSNDIDFYGIDYNDTLQAVIGVQSLQHCALLRSLAVDESFRGLGYAQELVGHVEKIVKDRGFDRIFLLTETAEHFFMLNAYKQIERTTAPDEIKQTAQYSSLCHVSCSVMMKEL